MSVDDEQARKARAERLHAQIEKTKRPAGGAPAPTEPEDGAEKPSKPESPRDFVHRRMRELRDKEDKS